MLYFNTDQQSNLVTLKPTLMKSQKRHFTLPTKNVSGKQIVFVEHILNNNFENKNDIEAFWQNSGLKTTMERRVLNESYIRSLPVVNKEVKSTVLPYTVKEIEMITDMACEYNR